LTVNGTKIRHATPDSGAPLQVLVDFDGTIVRQDATDVVLARLALPEWRNVEEEWVAGRIGSRECLSRQIDLVRATEAEIDSVIAGIEMDPAFPAFVALCRELGFDVRIASDGLDRVIAAVLKRAGLNVPFSSSHLVQTGERTWRLEFPHAIERCEALNATCKCALARGAKTLFVGDGRSDFCVSEHVSLVLAKQPLAQHCRDNGIRHLEIGGFNDAIQRLHDVFAPKAVAAVESTMMTGAARA
jgi:2-hydroxy-3-keto-5-methylthiopentenyl-1-phosphate phosphatase